MLTAFLDMFNRLWKQSISRATSLGNTVSTKWPWSSSTVKHHLPGDLQPYEYTSGRWLHRDGEQRQARFLRFNFPALCDRVVKLSPNAKTIVECVKTEGGFNRVFLFSLDNGERIVARLPFRIAGPARLVTNSEVATIEYLRSHTSIPIPKILDWNDDSCNPIGAEYIIMEQATGTQLHRVWPEMNAHQHMLCVKALARIVQQMTQLRFPAYGSLYFHDAPVDSTLEMAPGRFSLGPHCGTQYWDCDLETIRSYERKPPNRGPWSSLEGYAFSLVDAGIAQIPKDEKAGDNNLSYQGSVHTLIGLMEATRSVMHQLATSAHIGELGVPMLFHPDLHARNIFVSAEDPTQITAVIDWQSTSIEPAFIFASETPDFVDSPAFVAERAGLIPAKLAEPEDAAAKAKRDKDSKICRQTFAVGLRGWSPKLYAARAADETLFRLFRFCAKPWTTGAAAIRQELVELSQRWEELGMSGQCPYQPSEEELARQKTDYEDYEAVQRLKLWLAQSLNTNTEGWVPSEAFESATEAHKLLFDEWMRQNYEPDNPGEAEDRARKMWPWDGVKS